MILRKKNWGVLLSSMVAIFIGARFLSFSIILPAEEFANLAIGIALAGFSFLLIPKVGDFLDYGFLSNAECRELDYEHNLMCAIQLSVVFLLIAFLMVWVAFNYVYEIERIYLVVCAFGVLVSSSLNSIVLPFYKASNRYQDFLLVELTVSIVGVAGIFIFYFLGIVWFSLVFSYCVVPIFGYIYALRKGGGGGLQLSAFFDFRHCMKVVKENKIIFANGYVSSVIKACNEHGIILLLGLWGAKIDVAVFSASKSVLAPIRSIQNFYQADVYRKLRNEKSKIVGVLNEIITDCRLRAYGVFIVTLLLTCAAYFLEVNIGYEKYRGLFACIFLLGCAASITISAIWTFPLALKFDLTTDRSKAALLRLVITFCTLIMLPSFIGGGVALLAATLITRLTLDLRLKRKVLLG